MREEATAVIHRSVDGGKESPNWALRTGCLAQALGWHWSLSDTKEFFLDSLCRVTSGVGCALEVWTGKFSVLMGGRTPDMRKVWFRVMHMEKSLD